MTTATADFPRTSITGSRAARVGNAVIADYVRTLASGFEPQTTNRVEPRRAELIEFANADAAETPQRAHSTLRGGYLSQERRRPCSFPSRALAELA